MYMVHPLETHHKPETPCVGICSTIYGDVICRGCFRHFQDVIDWNTYSPTHKNKILTSLEALTVQVLEDALEIFDLTLLTFQCEKHRIKIRPEWSPYTWVHALLREGIHCIKSPEKYGFTVKPPLQHLSISALTQHIDDELYDASQETTFLIFDEPLTASV